MADRPLERHTMIIREKILRPLKHRADAVIDYLEPYIIPIAIFGIFWFIAFHILLLLFATRYGY